MRLKTRHFGEIEIQEDDIIHFPHGLLAFDDIKKYVIIPNPDPQVPFQWLQSVDNTDLAFVITSPFLFLKNYEFDLPDKVIKTLEIGKPEDIMIYSIAVVPENLKEMTINLRGPIIINLTNKRAKQIILDNEKYSLKHKIFQDTEQAG